MHFLQIFKFSCGNHYCSRGFVRNDHFSSHGFIRIPNLVDPTLKATGRALGSEMHSPWFSCSHLQSTSKSYPISLYNALSFPFAFRVASSGFFDILPIIFTFRGLFDCNLIIQLQSDHSIAEWLFNCKVIIQLQSNYSIAKCNSISPQAFASKHFVVHFHWNELQRNPFSRPPQVLRFVPFSTFLNLKSHSKDRKFWNMTNYIS